MSKEVVSTVSLQIGAGKANPAPPVGTVLGPRGINIMEFCKRFNAETASLPQGEVTPVVISIYKDKSFTFVIKQPPVAELIKQKLGIKVGSATTKRSAFVGSITHEDILSIAKRKMPDLNVNSIDGAINMIKGSAASMGIEVKA